jgi:hypothetical protein
MKPYLCVKSDFDNEVIDLFLVFKVQGVVFEKWIQGFDDIEWQAALDFAHEVAHVLNVPFVGDKTDE